MSETGYARGSLSPVIEVGARVGRLTMVRPTDQRVRQNVVWECACDCGAARFYPRNALRKYRSCGCIQKEKLRGHCGHPEYQLWASMLTRCSNPKSNNFHVYGGRGITVCDRWRDFRNFIADMGPRPSGFSLDRTDNDLGYSKGNCVWASRRSQSRNTSRNIVVVFDGTKYVLKDLAAKLGVNADAARYHIRKGIDPLQAILMLRRKAA